MSFTLRNNSSGKEFEFPTIQGKKGNNGIDFSNLYLSTGYYSYDPGLKSTATCKSSICFIDGQQGILEYRGYNICDLIKKHDFLDIAYLLIFKKFPSPNIKEERKNYIIEEQKHLDYLFPILKFLNSSNAPIDNLKILYSHYTAHNKKENIDKLIFKILGAMPLLIYMAYSKKPPAFTDSDCGKCFLMNYFECTSINPVIVNTFQKFLILHAEHEQNASTSAVRVIGSAGNSPLNSIFSGMLALEGTRHGGANEAVIKQLQFIDNIQSFLNKAKNDKIKIPGLGHRVYRTTDPRAIELKKLCSIFPTKNDLFTKALQLETLIKNDEYFVSRKLLPNLDFYSGILLNNIGIPTNLFLMIFVMARTAGWLAHWTEMHNNDEKIFRPRQIFVTD